VITGFTAALSIFFQTEILFAILMIISFIIRVANKTSICKNIPKTAVNPTAAIRVIPHERT
jgi:hypothetical protein